MEHQARQVKMLHQLAATLLLLLAAAPNTHSEEDQLPECEAGESPYMNKEKAPIQNMHQAAPQSDNRKAYAELPACITTLTQEDFSFGEQIAQLSLGDGEPERPWIVDFYTTSRTDVKKRLSEDDELSFLAAAELAQGTCGFAVCNLNEAVKGHARAFPAYPATFAYAQANMFRGRMFASPWKGNRTIRALVDTCLDHAKQELAPELLAKLEAAEVSGHDIPGIWVAFFQECQQYRCGQDMCVLGTARGAAELGYNTLVVDDATATLTQRAHDEGLLVFARTFGRVAFADDVLEELAHFQAT